MTGRDHRTMQEEIFHAEARLAKLDEERDRASKHLLELKARLSSIQKNKSQHPPMRQTSLPSEPVRLSSKQKLALFMDLFRGRTDVYPKRWVNTKKGTKGYSPACSNEWVRGVCDKKKVKCGECPNQAFIPVTEKTFHDQFKGRHEIALNTWRCREGVSPI